MEEISFLTHCAKEEVRFLCACATTGCAGAGQGNLEGGEEGLISRSPCCRRERERERGEKRSERSRKEEKEDNLLVAPTQLPEVAWVFLPPPSFFLLLWDSRNLSLLLLLLPLTLILLSPVFFPGGVKFVDRRKWRRRNSYSDKSEQKALGPLPSHWNSELLPGSEPASVLEEEKK